MGMNAHADIVVIGGGLAGLVAAARASEPRGGSALRVVLVEGAQPGGRARTDERNGYRFNQGAHAVYLQGAGRQIMLGLGIDPHGGPPALKHTYVWHDGQVFPLPASATKLMASKLLGARAKAQIAKLLPGLGKIDPAPLATMSASQWLDSLELQPEARQLLSMLVRTATYADPDAMPISADAAVRQLQMAMAEGVRYIDGGWQTMINALLAVCRAQGVEVQTKATALSVIENGDRVEVTTSTETWSAGAVIIASGGPAAAVGLLGSDPGWGDLGEPVTAACLDLGLTRPPERPVLFGFAEPLYLSTHCPPADLAPEGGAVVQLMRYGARDAATDRARLTELATGAGIAPDTIVEQRFLARMHVAWTVPTADRGGLRGRPDAQVPRHDRVFVAGDWVGPEGLLADAAITSGAAAATAARSCVTPLAAAR
jgi:phytoene dehydrogenase-like protein